MRALVMARVEWEMKTDKVYVCVCSDFRFLFSLILFCLAWIGSHHIVMQYNVLQTICFVSLLRFSFHSPLPPSPPPPPLPQSHSITSFTHSHISQYCSILFSFRLNFMAWILMFIHSIISLSISSLLHTHLIAFSWLNSCKHRCRLGEKWNEKSERTWGCWCDQIETFDSLTTDSGLRHSDELHCHGVICKFN